jgi:hypothetical protein
MLIRALAAAALIALATPTALADDPRHTLAVYFMGVGMDGTTSVGPIEGDVNVSFSDILENLEFGGMLAYRADLGRWSVTTDALYMGLGATKDSASGFLKSDVDVTQWMLEVDGGYEQNERLEWLFGLRYINLDTEIVITPDLGPVVEADASKSWLDPVVGARWTQPIGKTWAFIGRADVGGFGIGSDFAWQAVARFEWKVSDKVGVSFGYRALSADYEDGEGVDRFTYDVVSAGPLAAVTFAF